MVIVVRLGPLSLQHRREIRVAELERIFATDVHLVEVATVAELVTAVATPRVIAVAIDAAPPGELDAAVAAAVSLPVLRPHWLRRRNHRGEIDETFDGYGLLTDTGVSGLADGELAPPDTLE